MIYQTNRKNKAEAITQILILTIAIFAISWIIGSGIEEVSASDMGCDNVDGNCFYPPLSCNGDIKSGLCSGEGELCCVPKTTTSPEVEPEQSQNKANLEWVLDISRIVAPVAIDKVMKEKAAEAIAEKAAANTITNVLTKSKALEIYNAAYDGARIAGKSTTLAKDAAEEAVRAAAETAAKALPGATTESIKAAGQAEVSALGKKVATYSLKEFLFGTTTETMGWSGVGGGAGPLASFGAIVVWSAVAFAVGRFLGGKFGLDVRQSQLLGYSLAAGTAAGLLATSDAIWGSALAGPWGLLIGAAVALVVFFGFARNTPMDIIKYNCLQWDSQSGKGLTEAQMRDRCKLCNSQKGFVCTEYQCRSLGQGCLLINEEDTGKELCIWNNTNDVLAPTITPWEEALLEEFRYTPDNTLSPPEKGVKITYTGTKEVTRDGTTRCAPAFTKVSFGVQLDEPAKCKISPIRLRNYSVMAEVFMGDGIRAYNHSFALRMPSQGALEAENFTVDNGGKYEFFVRCQDSNGNSNVASFVFKFCISQGPHTTPPKIEGTSLYNNQPITFGQRFTDIEVYVDEPAECRWSNKDQNYDTMENNMTCAKNFTEMNAQMLYTCRGNLTGLKDGQENKFYFRCKDQPYLNATRQNERNVNRQSYILTLIGTVPLIIQNLEPTGIIKSPTEIASINITAETDGGYEDGNSICAFSETGASGSYIDFFYGYDVEPFSNNIHSQELGLVEGNYTYFIQCRDKGGNRAEKNVSFSVQVDDSPPIVVRVYKEDEYLKLITDEFATCVYTNLGCDYSFDKGTEMDSFDGKEHYVEWDISKDFYIKCEDEYEKRPLSNQCSIVARPFEIFQVQ